jgi:membrane protein YqaA with SNARE-associated domain
VSLRDNARVTDQDDGALTGTSDQLQHYPLLPDRPANIVADWLQSHPVLFRWILWGVVLLAIVTGVTLFFLGKLEARNVGYGGVFAINLIGSASVVVPVPGLAAACATAVPIVGLNLPLLALVGALGSTIGELTGYMAGYGGQSFVQKIKHYDRVHSIVLRRGAIALFVLSAIPNPIFDIAGIASGSVGYPVRRFLLWVLLGKLVKFAAIAYGCRYGVDWVTSLI